MKNYRLPPTLDYPPGTILAIFSGIPLAATPVPLNKFELTVELGVEDNQLSAAIQFFL